MTRTTFKFSRRKSEYQAESGIATGNLNISFPLSLLSVSRSPSIAKIKQQGFTKNRREEKQQGFLILPLPKLKFKDQEPRRMTAMGWTKLEQKISIMPEPWFEGEMLFLENLRTLKMKETATDVFVFAQLLTEMKCSCGVSESKAKKNGLTEPYMVYDLPFHNKRVSIYYRAQRYLCSGCGESFQQSFANCSESHRMTKRLLAYLEKKSFSIYSTFSEIARETGIREHVIRNIFTQRVIELHRERVVTLPAWVAVDEMYPASGKYKRFVISDPLNGRILDILGSDSESSIREWFKQTKNPGDVKVVSMNMHSPYKLAVGEALPKVECSTNFSKKSPVKFAKRHIHTPLGCSCIIVFSSRFLSIKNV